MEKTDGDNVQDNDGKVGVKYKPCKHRKREERDFQSFLKSVRNRRNSKHRQCWKDTVFRYDMQMG